MGCILRRIAAGENVFSRGERLFDRFRVDDVFAGGMGVVYAVTDAHTGRRYALKTPKRPAGAAVLDRFREEARTWIGLGEHPHVVQALWLIEAPEPYLVLEYVRGESLASILARGPVGVRRALDLAMQCAAGLAYAHRKPLAGGIGLVHRDVKPANLLVTPEDHLKISDFGLARVGKGGGPGGWGRAAPGQRGRRRGGHARLRGAGAAAR
ncbi:MAG: serine/threonine protein kinase, partial [Planctomycetes bacterium]|nr:serine/threonine protein kinase [Planctomycetota bacterium]